jgi:hypothetical protein
MMLPLFMLSLALPATAAAVPNADMISSNLVVTRQGGSESPNPGAQDPTQPQLYLCPNPVSSTVGGPNNGTLTYANGTAIQCEWWPCYSPLAYYTSVCGQFSCPEPHQGACSLAEADEKNDTVSLQSLGSNLQGVGPGVSAAYVFPGPNGERPTCTLYKYVSSVSLTPQVWFWTVVSGVAVYHPLIPSSRRWFDLNPRNEYCLDSTSNDADEAFQVPAHGAASLPPINGDTAEDFDDQIVAWKCTWP